MKTQPHHCIGALSDSFANDIVFQVFHGGVWSAELDVFGLLDGGRALVNRFVLVSIICFRRRLCIATVFFRVDSDLGCLQGLVQFVLVKPLNSGPKLIRERPFNLMLLATDLAIKTACREMVVGGLVSLLSCRSLLLLQVVQFDGSDVRSVDGVWSLLILRRVELLTADGHNI